jgi:hypothetical protein
LSAVRFGLLPLQLGRLRLLLQLLLPVLFRRQPVLLSPFPLPLVCCRPLPLQVRLLLSSIPLSRFPLLAVDLGLLLLRRFGPDFAGRRYDAQPG